MGDVVDRSWGFHCMRVVARARRMMLERAGRPAPYAGVDTVVDLSNTFGKKWETSHRLERMDRRMAELERDPYKRNYELIGENIVFLDFDDDPKPA